MQNPAHSTSAKTRLSALAIGAFATAFTALPASASAGVAAPDAGASPTGDAVNTLYFIIGALGLIALIAVAGSLLSASRGGPKNASDSDTAKPAVVGSIVFVIALSILGGLTLSGASSADESAAGTASTYKLTPLEDPNLKTGHSVDLPKGPALGVWVNGQQFLWRYSYLGKPVYSYHDLVVPVGVTVVLYVTSSDVEHNWWVPQLGASIQAIPGYVNTGWIRADKAGTYKGSSTVISGTNYQNMTTRVIAKSPEEFDDWLDQKSTEIREAGAELTAGSTESTGAAE